MDLSKVAMTGIALNKAKRNGMQLSARASTVERFRTGWPRPSRAGC
jgi:hypothetical protein